MVVLATVSSWDACSYGPMPFACLTLLLIVLAMISAASKPSAKGVIVSGLLSRMLQMLGRCCLMVLHSGEFREPKIIHFVYIVYNVICSMNYS